MSRSTETSVLERNRNRRRDNGALLFLVLLLAGILCLAGLLLFQVGISWTGPRFVPVLLDSVLEADYNLDPNPTRWPGPRFDLIWDVIHDREPGADLEARQQALLDKLKTPIPIATTQLCQGQHVIYPRRDTWVENDNPAAVHGEELSLRLGRQNGSGDERVLLYFPITEVITPGTFIAGAHLELDTINPTVTPPALLYILNLERVFTETTTTWSNQPASSFTYRAAAIPNTTRHTWNVTDIVQDWLLQRQQNEGLALEIPPLLNRALAYHSREAGLVQWQTGGSSRPQGPRLVIYCGRAISEPEIAAGPVTSPSSTPAGVSGPDPLTTPGPGTPPVPPGPTPAPPTVGPALQSPTPVPPTPAIQPSATGAGPTPTSRPATSTPVIGPPATATVIPPTSPPPTSPPATSRPPGKPTSPPPTSPPPQADLTISKSDSPDPVLAGGTLTYSLVITNNGPANATGVVVTDTLPADVTFVSASAGCSHTAGLVTCNAGSLANGGADTYQILVTVNAGASGILLNGAEVSGSETDPNPGSNSATAGTTITTPPQADLLISKSDSPDPVLAGGTLTYSLVITNNGPANATGVVITDTLPTDVTFVSASAGCSHTAGLVTCNAGSLANGGADTYQILVTINAGASGILLNGAEVSGSETDPNPGNNSATAGTTIAAPTDTDLTITKSDSPDPVLAGGTLTYSLVITNNGPANATGVVVTDTLPADVTFVSASAGCFHTAGVVTCNAGSLTSGGADTYQVVVTVNAGASGILLNGAEVSGSETDPNPGNNSATAGTTIAAPTDTDLTITKSDSPDPVLAGGTLTYSLVITNNGPANATGVVITDTLPADVTFVSASAGCSHTAGVVTCNVGSLASGGTDTYQILVTVNAGASGILLNGAEVSGSETDPVSNNTSTVSTTVVAEADLRVSKSVDETTPSEGDRILYTVTVVNDGPSHATGVIINDALPADLTYESDNSGGNYNSGTGAWTIGNLDSSAGATLLITATVNTGTAGTTITNTATISAGDPTDPVSGNNTASVTLTPAQPPLTLTLTEVWDAWMEANNPGNQHGGEDNMQVQPPPPAQEYRSLINFHTLTTDLPAGSIILTATLHLYQDGTRSGQTISIYPVTTNWVEADVRWSKATNGPGGDWIAPGGGGDFDTSTTWATFDPATAGDRYIDITGLVQAWIDGTYTNYGMILIAASSGVDDGAVRFYTHEYTTAAWRPSLEIVYTTIGVSPFSLGIDPTNEEISGREGRPASNRDEYRFYLPVIIKSGAITRP